MQIPIVAKFLILIPLAGIALSPVAQAVDPPPDGGYANNNTAEGVDALFSLADDTFDNTGLGFNALFSNTTGFGNSASGSQALYANTVGYNNTACGVDALSNNRTGANNTASGASALAGNTTGTQNTAQGVSSLLFNTTGSSNIALGWNAGINLTTGSNNIEIGNRGITGESKTIRIGKQGTQTMTYVAGISGATVAGGVGVVVDSKGRLGTVTSSEHFKEAIKPMNEASEAILALKPVTFRYKHELDPDSVPQFGLVAEQVAKTDPDLVARDGQGKPYTVRYEAVNAMLLNEFLKEHRKVEALAFTVAQQEKEFGATITQLETALKTQAEQIQKVNNRLEANSAPPRLIVNAEK